MGIMLHRIFAHRILLFPLPVALIGGPIVVLLRAWFTWTQIWGLTELSLVVVAGIFSIGLGIAVIAWIFED